MISRIAYTLILGKPLIMYGGIITFLFLLVTASIMTLNRRGITAIPLKWHIRMAVVTIILATLHAIFGFSAYFNF